MAYFFHWCPNQIISFLTSIIVLSAISSAACSTSKNATHNSMDKVTFSSHFGVSLAGDLYHPCDFNPDTTYAAIITVSPAGGVKEQTSGLYAQKLAKEGFITLSFDAFSRGESGGLPRYQESSIARVEDIRGAVDYLVSLPYVDANHIAVLGICAGGGYAASAAMTERRIKAVGLVVPVNGGRENRAAGQQATIASLEQIAELRSAESRGEEPTLSAWIPDEYINSTDIDQREAYDYYRTSRGGLHPNWENKVQMSTMDAVMAFDAFYLADMLLTQPLRIIVGSKIGSFGSNQDGHTLYEDAASTKKDIVVMEGASHFDLYDKPQYVDVAVDSFAAFFRANLS